MPRLAILILLLVAHAIVPRAHAVNAVLCFGGETHVHVDEAVADPCSGGCDHHDGDRVLPSLVSEHDHDCSCIEMALPADHLRAERLAGPVLPSLMPSGFILGAVEPTAAPSIAGPRVDGPPPRPDDEAAAIRSIRLLI
jgi:hypothetical protein